MSCLAKGFLFAYNLHINMYSVIQTLTIVLYGNFLYLDYRGRITMQLVVFEARITRAEFSKFEQ